MELFRRRDTDETILRKSEPAEGTGHFPGSWRGWELPGAFPRRSHMMETFLIPLRAAGKLKEIAVQGRSSQLFSYRDILLFMFHVLNFHIIIVLIMYLYKIL